MEFHRKKDSNQSHDSINSDINCANSQTQIKAVCNIFFSPHLLKSPIKRLTLFNNPVCVALRPHQLRRAQITSSMEWRVHADGTTGQLCVAD